MRQQHTLNKQPRDSSQQQRSSAPATVPKRSSQAKFKPSGKAKQKRGKDTTLSDLTQLLSQKSELPLSTPPELQNYIHHLENTLSNLTLQHERVTSSLAKLKSEHEALKESAQDTQKKKDALISKLRGENAALQRSRDAAYTREKGDIGAGKKSMNTKGFNSFR